MSLQTGLKQFEAFKKALEAPTPNIEECGRLLTDVKLTLSELSAFFPDPSKAGSQRSKELLLARETLELACLFATKARDVDAFERNVAQVKTFYRDHANQLPESERQNLILGLNLLHLLAQNRIAEFHTELEAIPLDRHDNLYIRHPIQLEQYLMEGTYHKAWEARTSTPDQSYQFFLGALMKTIREEAADCAEQSYQTLASDAAQKTLHLDSPQELASFAEKRGWTIDNGIVNFHTGDKAEAEIPTKKVIAETLKYARELERIV